MNKSGELFKKIAEQRSQIEANEANSEINSESNATEQGQGQGQSQWFAPPMGNTTTSTPATTTGIFRSPSQVNPCPRCQWQCEADIPCPLCGGTSVSDRNSQR